MNEPDAEILLIYPGEPVPKPRLPMSLLAIGSHCIHNKYPCKIVDERVAELTEQDISRAAIIGISSMSGAQLKSAVHTAHRIKRLRPDVPLIWGGAHPTSFPKQTAESPLVDVVVRAEGEAAFLSLCRRIRENQDYSDVPAITFRRHDQIIDNPLPDEWMNMEQLHPILYELVDVTKYADFEDGLSYESSRGCPFQCTFCYAASFHRNRWRGKSPAKVISELEAIRDKLGITKLFIVDDNFFCNKSRTMDICDRMISSGIPFRWSATVRADRLSTCSEQDMHRIQNSGCEILAIGAESGSERVLRAIKKRITSEQVAVAVRKCVSHNIMPAASFIIGLPYEEESDLRKTLDLYDELMALGRTVEINGLFIYIPYAGTSLFETAMKYGYRPKDNLAAWTDWDIDDSLNTPWLTPAKRKRAQVISSIARFKYMRHRFEFYSDEYRKQKLKSPLRRLGYLLFVRLLAANAGFRWKHRFFRFAPEWRLWAKLTYLVFKIR